MDGNVQAGLVQGGADLGDRFVAAVESGPEDRDHADGVLVAAGHGFGGGEVQAVAVHGDQAGFDVPVVGELLPADLDVDAHDQVRAAGAAAGLLPATLE